MQFQRTVFGLLGALLLLAPPSLLAAGLPKLAAPPLGERWFSISLSGERVGFAHLNISVAGDGYRIDADGSVKMRVMGFSREASTKESYLVGRDLAIRSFAEESRIDGSPLTLKGEVTPTGIRFTVASGSGKKERTLKFKEPVYPPQLLNCFPLMKGASAGKSYRVPILDLESVKVKKVTVEVVAEETLTSGSAALHLRNDLYPVVDNDVWVDLQGNTVRESVRDDLVVTLAESEASARAFLADFALSKSDLALDFSRINVTPPLQRPEQLKKLTVEFTGIPRDFPLLQGEGEQAIRLTDGKVRFTMPNPRFVTPPGAATAPADLEPAPRIPSDNPDILAKMDEIVRGEREPVRVANLLAGWVAKAIKGTVTDNQSPVETLKSLSGNCQTHARLYTALARGAGIPTRFVSGLVYSPGQGFLYHSWAESYLNGVWVSVDPTFDELPANVTHVKLAEGDSPDDIGLLAGVIGRIQVKVDEQVY